MDSDRRSNISSAYSSRPPGAAAPTQQHQPRPSGASTLYDTHGAELARRDSNSTFFSPPPGRGGGGTAGYNRASYFDTGREEPLRDHEEGDMGKGGGDWDVYADFNNTGPRYSTAFGLGNEHAYQPIHSPSSKNFDPAEVASPRHTPGGAELVTVPALGPDWKSSELHALSKAGRREAKSEARRKKWDDWRRGRSGGRWFNRKAVVFFVFALCIVIGLALFFTLPRVPSFQFNAERPLNNDSSPLTDEVPMIFSRTPANFSFAAVADLRIDTGGNFIPVHMKKIKARIIDPDTGYQLAHGELKDQRYPTGKKSKVAMPLNFTYSATNDSDKTWINWYNACKNKINYADGKRPGVNFNLVIDMTVFGLFGTKHDGIDIINAACPIMLPTNSV
jgi:hypothetical protein